MRSSIARRLGMDIGALTRADRDVEGVVEMMLDATQSHRACLTEERLFAWHAALFPTGRSGIAKIIVGAWRDDASGPMQVVSGPVGRRKIHYEAPAAARLPAEMAAFLDWFNGDARPEPVLKAAIAHFWFVTLHPFDDGNGRIARAIADMSLARAEGSPQRFYSMSAQIRVERKAYYAVLERTQKSALDITAWLQWFLNCLDRAFDGADVINRLLDGFEGKLTPSKWATWTRTSPDTALRDIKDLVERGILVKDEAGGRSTSYSLAVLEKR